MANRPNFLFIITDQHRADHLGCYGNPVVRTPNIDRLAQNGTRFERFYVATPICMPNRATLMTGRMPSLHGARQNGIPLSLTATTFVDIMRAAGYNTALIGKCHLQSINGNPPVVGMPEADPDRSRRRKSSAKPTIPWAGTAATTKNCRPPGRANPTSSRRSPITALITSSLPSATAIKPSATTRAGSRRAIRIPTRCAARRTNSPATATLRRRPGARECRKRSIRRHTLPSVR